LFLLLQSVRGWLLAIYLVVKNKMAAYILCWLILLAAV
jgi:hypothetical protein